MKYIIGIAVILYIAYNYYIRSTANDEVDQYDYRAEVSS